MDERKLRIFYEVSSLKSFTGAAVKLNIAQPAVSMAVRQLEDDLEIKLINRKNMNLTVEGEVLFERARDILCRLEDAKIEMEELRGGKKGTVRLGMPNMAANEIFAPIIYRFIREYPDIDLKISSSGAGDIRKKLINREIDLGISSIENLEDDFEYMELTRDEMCLCVSYAHRLASFNAVSFNDIEDEPLILFEDGNYQRDVLQKMFSQRNIQPKIFFEANMPELIKKLVADNFGITSFLKRIINNEKNIRIISFDPKIEIPIGFIWHKDVFMSGANKLFMGFAKDYI